MEPVIWASPQLLQVEPEMIVNCFSLDSTMLLDGNNGEEKEANRSVALVICHLYKRICLLVLSQLQDFLFLLISQQYNFLSSMIILNGHTC